MSAAPYPPSQYAQGAMPNYPAPDMDRQALNRTPSPTPSEYKALSQKGTGSPLLNAIRNGEWKKAFGIGLAIVLVVLLFVFNKQIVNALMPAANWMHGTKGGFLIPVAVLIVLSFPPLLGHEVVLFVVGVTWGLGVGFAIGAAGTIIGELMTFLVFKYMCRARMQKTEKKDINLACLSRVVCEGGWIVALIARYSTIPGHLITALFASCGMSITTFFISAILSLPKQFATVYLGYALSQHDTSRTEKIVKYVVIGATVVITIAAMRYIRGKQSAVKPAVIYERRKRRQAQLKQQSGTPSPDQGSDAPYFPPRPLAV